VAVLCAASVLGIVTTPGTAAAAVPVSPERRAWVQGDSVLLGAKDVVDASLDGWQRTVGAFIGLPTSTAIQVFRDRQADLGSVVVVEVGLNDWGSTEAAYSLLIDEAMDVLGDRQVIWLTTTRHRQEMDGVNAAIRASANRHANFEVLEWGPLSDAHPEATDPDRIHLRPVGQRMLATAIRDALDRWWVRRCTVADGEATNSVSRLYRAYFLRAPDAAGLEYWRARWRSGELCLPDVSEYFAGSAEFLAAYGQLAPPDFVQRVYRNVLGREPDATGFDHWTTHLERGAIGRGTMMVAFSESPEFRERSGLA
jgi:hypothetical protein